MFHGAEWLETMVTESNAYWGLAFSMAPVGGLLVVLGWMAGGGGLAIELNVLPGSLILLGVGLMAVGPWLVLFRYRTILRRRRAKETP